MSIGLARLGLAVRVLTVLGNDFFGRYVLDQYEAAGLDTSYVSVSDLGAMALSVSVSLPHDRSFLTYRGVGSMTASYVERLLGSEALESARHVHVAGAFASEELLSELLDVLKAAGMTTSLDIGYSDTWPHTFIGTASSTDVFLCNESEALAVTGAASVHEALRTLSGCIKVVVVKLGPRGAIASAGGQVVSAAPPPVEVVDTTGAGDSFCAGFIYGYLQKRSLEECLVLGNICGAFSTRDIGGIAAFPTREEIEATLAGFGEARERKE